jgi:RNA polymerase sigma-70 factor (ECF subfamily)
VNESDQIERARLGDEFAWESLIDQHREAVFRLAYLLLGDAHDAEDIAQETFIRTFRHLDRFDAHRPLRPWLLHIAANLARNRRRSIGRYLAALGRMLQANPEGVTTAEAETIQQWEAQTLWQAVRQLSPTDQEVIYLRYFLDLSVAETAQTLAVAPGTVKSRLHRALAHLRAVMTRDFPALVVEHET